MEKKLAEYRAKKRREAKINEIKSKTKNFFLSLVKSKKKPEMINEKQETEDLLVTHEDNHDDCSSTTSEDDNLNCCTYFDMFYYFLWFILWVILLAIFIEFQFGSVFLITSAIILMYVNTRTGPKPKSEVSAYSVFNKNCESIDGTLKAEQFEREIRYGPMIR